MKKNIKYGKEIRKESFDDLELPTGLWDRIEESLIKEKKRRIRIKHLKILSSAAAVLCLLYLARIVTPNFSSSVPNHSENELAKENNRYATMVDDKKQELLLIKEFDPNLYANYSAQLKKMNEHYQVLQKEYSKSPGKNSVLRAMIVNLKMQLQVINNQLEVLDYLNANEKKSSNEKI